MLLLYRGRQDGDFKSLKYSTQSYFMLDFFSRFHLNKKRKGSSVIFRLNSQTRKDSQHHQLLHHETNLFSF